MIRPSTDRAAMVDTAVHWIDLNDRTPGRGQKVLLINRYNGVAVISTWSPTTEWTHWAPLPTFRKEPADER